MNGFPAQGFSMEPLNGTMPAPKDSQKAHAASQHKVIVALVVTILVLIIGISALVVVWFVRDYNKDDSSSKNTTTTGALGQDMTVVTSLADFPDPVGNVITLGDAHSYYIDGEVDLQGNRLVGSGPRNSIVGTSSESSILTSTGLPEGEPLIRSNYTMPLIRISIRNVHTAFYFGAEEGVGGEDAGLDWNFITVVDVTRVGEIGTVANFVMSNSAFLNSGELRFTGEVGSIVFSDCLFTNFASGYSLNIANPLITRRFRLTNCSMVALGSSTAALHYAVTSIPQEQFILDKVNFNANTPVSGIAESDLEANFVGCTGITNSSSIGSVYITANTVVTTITGAGVPVSIGATVPSESPQQDKFNFESAVHGLRYRSSIAKKFLVTVNMSLSTSASNSICALFIGKRNVSAIDPGDVTPANIVPVDDLVTNTEVRNTTSRDRDVALATQFLVELGEDDMIYPIVSNTNGTQDIEVSFMNLIILRTSE
jgi:hypothetical protein